MEDKGVDIQLLSFTPLENPIGETFSYNIDPHSFTENWQRGIAIPRCQFSVKECGSILYENVSPIGFSNGVKDNNCISTPLPSIFREKWRVKE